MTTSGNQSSDGDRIEARSPTDQRDYRAALEDLTRENERLNAYIARRQFGGPDVLDRALAAERQVAAVRALCDDSRQVLWPSAHGYPSGWTLDPAAVLAALDSHE